jgi:Uma2 family endonuclease
MAIPAYTREHYTWADYRSWDDSQRWELVDGQPIAMSPAPSFAHQAIVLELGTQLQAFFRGKTCRPMVSPIDLKLADDVVLQPDLLVVCDPRQIHSTHIEGPPALVIEVTSPSSVVHGRVRKTALYARAGVPEYWLVTPEPGVVEVLRLDGATYRLASAWDSTGTLTTPGFPGLAIALAELFAYPPGAAEPPGVADAATAYATPPRPPPPWPGTTAVPGGTRQ